MIRLGMGAKFSVAVALLILVFAIAFAIYFPGQQKSVAQEALERRGLSVAHMLAPQIDLTDTPSEMERKLRNGMDHERDIEYVAVYRNRAIIAKSVRDGAGVKPPDSPPGRAQYHDDDYLYVTVPIRREGDRDSGEPPGWLSLSLSQKAVTDAGKSATLSAIIGGLIIFLVGVVVAYFVGRGIAMPLLSAADELNRVSATLATAAREQETSSAEEAAAVAQTRRSMETLLNSAQSIADRSSEVLGNAERSTNGSRQIADRIGNLNELAEKIAEILATIMQVADKADLLALNASLEGTRAGEAGKGFALVAAEMRRLAENVMESVTGIRELMQEMREASQAAVSASQEGTRSSTATTHSAREIALLTQEQRQATEQVIASMDEMGKILNHTLESIQRTTKSASQLTALAETLSQAVRPDMDAAAADGADDDFAGEHAA